MGTPHGHGHSQALPECLAFRTRHRADVAFIVTMAGRIIQMSHGHFLEIQMEHQDIPNGADGRFLYGLYRLNGLKIAELYSVLLHSIVVTYLVRMTNPDKYMASAGIFAT